MFTTVGDLHVLHGAGRRLAAAPSSGRRMPRLPDDAVAPGRIDGSQDRADIVRILDAVEDHDQGRARGRRHELFERVGGLDSQVGHHALMHASSRLPFNRAPVTVSTGIGSISVIGSPGIVRPGMASGAARKSTPSVSRTLRFHTSPGGARGASSRPRSAPRRRPSRRGS